MKRALRYVLALLGISMGVVAVWGWLIHEQGSRELEEVRAKIRAEGGALTFEDLGLEPGEIKTEGFVRFAEACNRTMEAFGVARNRVGTFQVTTLSVGRVKLVYGGAPQDLGFKKGFSWDDVYEAYRPVREGLQQCWSIFESEDVSFRPAYGHGLFTAVTHVRFIVGFSQICTILSYFDLQKNDVEAALETLSRCRTVSETLQGTKRHSLVEALVSVTVDGMLAWPSSQIVEMSQVTDEQLERLAGILGSPRTFEYMVDGLQGERIIMGESAWVRAGNRVESTKTVPRTRPAKMSPVCIAAQLMELVIYRPLFMNGDHAYYLSRMWEAESAARRLAKSENDCLKALPSFPGKHLSEGEFSRLTLLFSYQGNDLVSLGYCLKHMPRLTTCLIMPQIDQSAPNMAYGEVIQRQWCLAIALRRYQLKHGEYPERLEELELDSGLDLRDPMTLEPMCYRRDEEVGYELYSRGLDGKDDGGVAVLKNSEAIRFDGKRAPDWLWPRPGGS